MENDNFEKIEKRKNKKIESIETQIVVSIIKPLFPDYDITIGTPLIYRVNIINESGYKPKDANKPTRGNFAFQTDILIKKNNMPLVVIEVKVGKSGTPHAIIQYSDKAIRHKRIYPHLRYGYLVVKRSYIDHFFYQHNDGFDFAFAIGDSKNTNSIEELVNIIKNQIKSAEILLKIFNTKRKDKQNTHCFNSIVNIE